MLFDSLDFVDNAITEAGIFAVDLDPATDDESRRVLGSGDVVTLVGGETRTIAAKPIEIAGVTRSGFVTAIVRFNEGGSGVVRFELRAGLADMNGDGVIDVADIGAFVEAFLGDRRIADTNGDGVRDLADLDTFVDAFLDATGG